MSAAAQELLAAFDSLPAPEQDVVVGQLLLRRPAGADDPARSGYDELADELFQTYDAAEAADADADPAR